MPPSDAVIVRRPARAVSMRYHRTRPVEFMPWVRSATLETHALITCLTCELVTRTGEAGDDCLAYLRCQEQSPLTVDQFSSDGILLASHVRPVLGDDIWRLSLGRAESGRLEYGLLALRGRYMLCHFQIEGPRTFATCHSRRFRLDQPLGVRNRWIPFPPVPGARLSLLLMNLGSGTNTITIRPMRRGATRGLQVEIPRLGCRMVELNRLLDGTPAGGRVPGFHIRSTFPYDYYTVIGTGEGADGVFSIQHVK